MAAEVATAMPDKTVILATSSDRLLADQPKSLSASAARALKSYGVQVRVCVRSMFTETSKRMIMLVDRHVQTVGALHVGIPDLRIGVTSG